MDCGRQRPHPHALLNSPRLAAGRAGRPGPRLFWLPRAFLPVTESRIHADAHTTRSSERGWRSSLLCIPRLTSPASSLSLEFVRRPKRTIPMNIGTQWQFAGLFQGAVILVLPAGLFLAAHRRHLLVRLALAVVVSWIAGIFAQAVVSPINEAHHLAHYHYNPADIDDYGPSYDDTAANGLAVFFGWFFPLLVCFLVAGISRLARLALHRRAPGSISSV